MAEYQRAACLLAVALTCAHTASASHTRKYLIGTFPSLRQVGYTMLPDNVWRPLVVGRLSAPQSVAVDNLNRRIFVSDPSESRIYWFQLHPQEDGFLHTDGVQHIALEGYQAKWMAINGVGDLYFTGHQTVEAPAVAYDAVFRKDAVQLATGDMTNAVEVYGRSNSGNPNPKVWMPSGIAVDSFFIYWGNQELGSTHGAVNRGSRQNIGNVGDIQLSSLTTQMDEARGLATTGTLIYYLSTGGIFATSKTATAQPGMPASEGRITAPPGESAASTWDPKSIAWDGDHTMYVSDNLGGKVYTVPTSHIGSHSLTHFTESPDIWGIGVLDCSENLAGSSHSSSFLESGSYATTALVGPFLSAAVVFLFELL